jgi:transposase-like protein
MSTMTYPKPYPPEFRREAVELVRSCGQSMRAVARDLDISYESLRLWVKQAEVDAGEREGLTTGRARGAAAAPAREPPSAPGAGDPEKRRCLLHNSA